MIVSLVTAYHCAIMVELLHVFIIIIIIIIIGGVRVHLVLRPLLAYCTSPR
jgi:hypothetical protein